MNSAPVPEDRLFVACLCAAWCHICGEYRAVFDDLAMQFGNRVQFVWVDIEDDEEALDPIDVIDFPTLLLAGPEEIHFFGPVIPHAQTARQLIERALEGQLGSIQDPVLAGVLERVRRLN